MCLGFEPGAAERPVQTDPLCYSERVIVKAVHN